MPHRKIWFNQATITAAKLITICNFFWQFIIGIIFWWEILVEIIIRLVTLFLWLIGGEYFGKRFWLKLLSDYFCDWSVENILVQDFGCIYYQIDDDIYVSDSWIILWGAIGDNAHIRLVKHSYDIASVFLSQFQAFFRLGYWFISHSLCPKINHHQKITYQANHR